MVAPHSFQYMITKTYGHDLGLSATFRQMNAESHCRHIHGYALGFKLTYGTSVLDGNGWVLDFGSLKPLKQWLYDRFDHKMLVHKNDPAASILRSMAAACDNVAIVEVDGIGCEAFARQVWYKANDFLQDNEEAWNRGVRLLSVECKEHGSNSAIYNGYRAHFS